MATATISLNKPHQAQREILMDRARFRVLCIGRRWGKTEVLIIAMVNRLLKGQRIWFCSPTNRNNKQVFPKLKKALAGIPDIYINNSDYIIELPNGGHVQFISLHEPDNLRGTGLDHIFIDEAGFIKQGVWDAVLRPMLLTTQGGATFASTPNGTGTDFHAWYTRGLDPLEPNWKTYHLPSHSSPLIPADELDDIKRHTPERAYRQEYLAEFLDDGGAVFRNLRACIQPPPERWGRVVFGVDWGRVNDYTVIVAMDADTGRMIAMDRFNQIDWTLQRARLEAMATQYRPFTILAEQNSIGDVNIEELKKSGLPVKPFKTTAQSKAEIINMLSLGLEQGDIGILDDEQVISELQNYTIERLPSGAFRYTAPSGLHDDIVMALALANKARALPSRIFV